VRKDKGLMWLLLDRIKQVATLPLEGSRGVKLERSMVHEIRRETIGTEVLRILLFVRTSRHVRSYSRNLLYNPARLILRFLAACARFP
jgi:hypothetical protein